MLHLLVCTLHIYYWCSQLWVYRLHAWPHSSTSVEVLHLRSGSISLDPGAPSKSSTFSTKILGDHTGSTACRSWCGSSIWVGLSPPQSVRVLQDLLLHPFPGWSSLTIRIRVLHEESESSIVRPLFHLAQVPPPRL